MDRLRLDLHPPMTMEDMQDNRNKFRRGGEGRGGGDALLDQTDMSLFNPSNAFDTEGLTRLDRAVVETRKNTTERHRAELFVMLDPQG